MSRVASLPPVRAIDIRNPEVAAQVQALHWQAYAQEAQLAGVESLPPMRRTAADLQALAETFHAVFVGHELAAAISVEEHAEPDGVEICSLAVGPAFQRRGLGRALLRWVLAKAGQRPVVVATAVANQPALALYRSMGFVECRRSAVSPDALELAHLQRPGVA